MAFMSILCIEMSASANEFCQESRLDVILIGK